VKTFHQPFVIFVAALSLALPVIAAANLQGATVTVTSTADSGPGTLRDAVDNASSGSTINFSLPSPAVIRLTGSTLVITKDLTILGPGAGKLSIDGNASSSVFLISPSNSVILAGLTITNGNTSFGGGIYNEDSDLTISNCTLWGNSATFGAGIQNLEVTGNAKLKIIGSTLRGNSAGNVAGAIYNVGEGSGDAEVQIINSTISGNSSGNFAAAVANIGQNEGAGHTTTHIRNSTFSGNSQTSDFGGDIVNLNQGHGHADVDLVSTLINTSGTSLFNDSGSITSLGFNLSSENGGGFLTGTNDRVNTNPLLGSLQDNGGPTFTHALLTGSPAIDQGKNFTGSNNDQRGLIRTIDFPATASPPGGDGTDIGAFEVQAATDTTLPTITCPPDMIVNATVPAGTTVDFPAPVATDDSSVVTVTCVPASGSFFGIGTTTVASQAVDGAGLTSSCSFTVHVAGAAEQVDNLTALVSSFDLKKQIEANLLAKLKAASKQLNKDKTRAANVELRVFARHCAQQAKKKKITQPQADQMIADATRIRAVLGFSANQ
jgi:hypothetical protein